MSVSNERSLNLALRRIVEGLAAEEGVALARIWLVRPGDICARCPMRAECPDQSACLHLVASDGLPLRAGVARTNALHGEYSRFPLGVRKVGHIGSTGEPTLPRCVDETAQWLPDPEWAQEEGIASFAGQPLLFRGQILGVLAVFSRDVLGSADMSALRTFAAGAAAAIANARAFEEIALLKDQLELENEYLRDEITTGTLEGDIVGESPALHKTLQQVELVAATDASVLILGETGTGKELVARRIHQQSTRRDRALIKVNCASVPHELFESEFFGHVKGAFTGAIKDRAGRFALADGGTLFLDEVGEIPIELQGKLLRALQEGVFERVGDERPQQTDVRIIAATNRDLEAECARGRFRQDLYFRLSVFPIEVAPLRTRGQDIPLLAASFLRSACKRMGLPLAQLKKKHLNELRAYDWPGNIRELQNVIERAVIVSQNGALHLDLPNRSVVADLVVEEQQSAAVVPNTPNAPIAKSYADLKDLEREMVLQALRAAEGKVSGRNGAAERLGIRPSTLTSKMAIMGIKMRAVFAGK